MPCRKSASLIYLHSHFSPFSPSTPSPFHLLPVSLQSRKHISLSGKVGISGLQGTGTYPAHSIWKQCSYSLIGIIQVQVFSNPIPSTSSSLQLLFCQYFLSTTFVSCVLSLHHHQLLSSLVNSQAQLLSYRYYCESPSAKTLPLLPRT